MSVFEDVHPKAIIDSQKSTLREFNGGNLPQDWVSVDYFQHAGIPNFNIFSSSEHIAFMETYVSDASSHE